MAIHQKADTQPNIAMATAAKYAITKSRFNMVPLPIVAPTGVVSALFMSTFLRLNASRCAEFQRVNSSAKPIADAKPRKYELAHTRAHSFYTRPAAYFGG
jgi:hypothetical protein